MITILILLLSTVTTSAEKLPRLSVLASTDVNGTQYELNGCKIRFKAGRCKLTLVALSETCHGKISLDTLLEHFFPGNNLEEKTNTFILPDKFGVRGVIVDKCSGDITFVGKAREKLEIIPRRFMLTDTKIKLSFNYKSGSLSWESLSFTMRGDLPIPNRTPVNVKVVKNERDNDATFTFDTDEILISDFTKLFTSTKPDRIKETELTAMTRTKILKYVDELEGVVNVDEPNILDPKSYMGQSESASTRLGVPMDISSMLFNKGKIVGLFDPAGSYEFVLTGLPKAAIFNGTFFTVAQKMKGSSTSVSIVAILDNLSPIEVLRQLIGKDICKFNLLSKQKVNMVLQISSKDIPFIKNEELASTLTPYISAGRSIRKGAYLQFQLPLREMMKDSPTVGDLDAVPDLFSLQVAVKKKQLVVTFPTSWDTDIFHVFDAITSNNGNKEPEWLDIAGSYPVELIKFTLGYEDKSCIGFMKATSSIKIGNVLILENVTFQISHRQDTWDLALNSSQNIADGVRLDTTLLKRPGRRYFFEGTIDEISIKQLLDWLRSKFLFKDILTMYSFMEFKMQNVKLRGEMKDTNMKIRIAGRCNLFDWKSLEVEGLLFNKKGKLSMALGIALLDSQLDDIIQKIFNKNILGAKWLRNLNAALTLSNVEARNDSLAFAHPVLRQIPILTGFRFQVDISSTSNCQEELLCKLYEEMNSGSQTRDDTNQLTLSGELTDTGMDARAPYRGKWQISENIEVPATELIVKAGKETGIWFKVNILVINPTLEMEGTIRSSLTGKLLLQAKTNDPWETPFKINFLEIRNVLFSLELKPGLDAPVGRIDGTLYLGVKEKRKQIKADVTVFHDPSNSKATYFYSKLKDPTLQGIADAFGLKSSLPYILDETFFPTGLIASYSDNTKGKMVEAIDTHIVNGFALDGLITLMNMNVRCHITFSNPADLFVSAALMPMKLANGALTIQRSETNVEDGPMFHAQLSTRSIVSKIEGYFSLWGISSTIMMDMSDDGFQFSLSGKIFNTIEANLTAKAPYSQISKAQFEVSSCVPDIIPLVQAQFKTFLLEATEEAQIAIQEANDTIFSINNMDEKAKRGREKMKDEIEKHNALLKQKAEEYEASKDFFKLKCLEECQNVCLGGVDWDPRCIELSGRFVGCPSWNNCKFKVLDEKCFAKCKGTAGFGTLKASVKQSALKALLQILKSIKRLYKIGQRFYNATQSLVVKAKEIVNSVNKVIDPALDIFTKVQESKVRLQNVVSIKAICFQGNLQDASRHGCLEFNLTANVFKTQELEFEKRVCMNSNFFKEMGAKLLEKLSPGIAGIKSGLSSIKSLFVSLNADKKNAEEVMAQSKSVNENEEETEEDESRLEDVSEDMQKTWMMWNAQATHYNRLANEMLPRRILIDSDYLKMMENESAYSVAAEGSPIGRHAIPVVNDSIGDKKDTILQDMESDDPCTQLSHSVKGYSELSSKLRTLVNSFMNEIEVFKNFKKRRTMQLDELESVFRSECIYNGCNKEELDDILYFVRKARQGNTNWIELVESQINLQDRETVNIWRNSFDNIMKKSNGTGRYISRILNIGQGASRAIIANRADKYQFISNMDMAAQTLLDILASDNAMTISEVDAKLNNMERYLGSMRTPSKDCPTRRIL